MMHPSRILLLVLSLTVLACGKSDTSSEAPRDTSAPASTSVGATQDTTPAAAAAPQSGDTLHLPPSELKAEMEKRFQIMGGMKNVRVDVSSDGVVVLTGTVATPDRKQTAEDAARMLGGRAVENRIVVN